MIELTKKKRPHKMRFSLTTGILAPADGDEYYHGGRWDTTKASEPCVIDLDDGRFRMFYEACDKKGRWRIASATSLVSLADGS